MTSIRDIRRLLTDLAQASRPLTKAELSRVKSFLNLLERIDALSLKEAESMFARLETSAPPTVNPVDQGLVGAIVDRLRATIMDDVAFAKALDAVGGDRKATKDILAEVFTKLFQRARGVPKSASRQEILRLIAGERLMLARQNKLWGVPAE